jgi:hypothetical protein
MKRFFLITLLTVLTATVGHAANDDIIVDGVVYEWSPNDLGYIVTGWDEKTPIQSLHIRGVVNELDVVRIAESAFDPENYTDEDNSLPLFESVEIDEGITYIGENAFVDCTGIKWVRMPSTLLTIGIGAFLRCTSLEYAFLNEGLKTIGEEAFAFCTSLTTMVIPSTVTEIQAHAFSECKGVTDVYFLMTEEEQLYYYFHWWDGVYEPGNEEHGGMEFNTNQHTTIHVPEGMLQDYVDSKKFVAWIPLVEDNNCYPLWWIVNFGVVGREYTVSDDEIAAVYADVDGGLYVKDDNHWLTPDKVYAGEIDYMKTTGLMDALGNKYDQSNWVVLTNVGNNEDDNEDELKGYIGKWIVGNSITGTLKNKKNPIIEVRNDAELIIGGDSPYVPNVYIPCSFMGRAQIGVNNKKTYAFVQPKPQELIHVEWSIYNDEDECFYIPEPDGVANTMGLRGGFGVSYDLYEKPNNMPELKDRYIYAFDAVNRLKTVSEPNENETKSKLSRLKDEEEPQYAPYTDGDVSDKFIVYPLELPEDPPMTGVPDIVDDFAQRNKVWYSIDGRFVGTTKPTVPGLYINGNRKVIVK